MSTHSPVHRVPRTHALFAGTFDPPTLGHLDLIRRAARLFDQLTVGVAANPGKEPMFDVETRLELLKELTDDIEHVDVALVPGLVVDACANLGANLLVRGVRSGTDFDYEVQMARTNRSMAGQIDTVLLSPSPEYGHISSTLVRQIASMGGGTAHFVPEPVQKALRERFGR